VARHLRLVREDSPEPASPPRSIDELFRGYARYVGTIGLRILGRADEVDDLVQDVFLDAHRGLAQVREPGAIKGWLATLTVRKARRRLHARRVQSFFGIGRDVDYEIVASSGASPEDRARIAELYRALDRIDADERLAWSLRYIEGEALEDVARICECSLATAKRRIASVQSKLQTEMRDE
jgi:RNA polymerase sigma-70 factor (ECF subfamily)